MINKVLPKWLEDRNISIIKIPDNLSIGASLVASWSLMDIEKNNRPLQILFGDTLLDSFPIENDVMAIATAHDSYNWAVVEDANLVSSDFFIDNDEIAKYKDVVVGYFSFNQPAELVKSIIKSQWSFLGGVSLYKKNFGLISKVTDGWLDFGHVNTYYRSKAEFTTQRAFNEIVITPYFIEKSSIHNVKIMAEAEWFEKLPFSLRGYIPQFLGSSKNDGRTTYRLEYLHNTALNEVYVFSALPSFCWKAIVNNCLDFLLDCQRVKNTKKNPSNQVSELFGAKTLSRINHYCQSKNISLNEHWKYNGFKPVSIQDLLDACSVYLPKDCGLASVLHGDFCFSNILYDFRAQKIKVPTVK